MKYYVGNYPVLEPNVIYLLFFIIIILYRCLDIVNQINRPAGPNPFFIEVHERDYQVVSLTQVQQLEDLSETVN